MVECIVYKYIVYSVSFGTQLMVFIKLGLKQYVSKYDNRF